jgi:integrin beta 3
MRIDADAVADAVLDIIEEPIAALSGRIEGLEKRVPESGARGEPGADGKDAPAVTREQIVEAILSMPDVIGEAITKYLTANPPAAGVNGIDGRDGVDGKDGAAGLNGKDGRDGIDSPSVDEIGALVRAAVAVIPVPQDGKDGAPGRDGVDGRNGADGQNGKDGPAGLDGKDGAPGLNGKDGVGVAGAIIDRAGGLVLTLSDGTTRDLGQVVGKDGIDGGAGVPGASGRDGADGRDGLGFEDIDLVEDERGITLRFQRGQVVKEFVLPVVVDRGVWREQEYCKGSGVTWAGSFWIAQRDTSGKPDTADGGWRLAVKRGRDGKDGKPGGAGK